MLNLNQRIFELVFFCRYMLWSICVVMDRKKVSSLTMEDTDKNNLIYIYILMLQLIEQSLQ